MCDGQEYVEAKWNCVFKEDFANPSGSIFSERRGIIYQDCYAPMGDGHEYGPGEHDGYFGAAPDPLHNGARRTEWHDTAGLAGPRDDPGGAGRPDLVELLANEVGFGDIPTERRERRTHKVYNGRLIQDAHMAAGGTLESFFDEHGFVLVDAPTAVTDFMDVDQCSIRRSGVYPREVEEIVRRVMPSRNINRIDHWSAGGGSHAPFPSGGSSGMAHQDTGFDPTDFVDSLMAYHNDVPSATDWADEYLRCTERGALTGFEGHMQINIWRPREMNDHPRPLTNMPLALLDGATIDAERDLVRMSLLGRGKLGDPAMEVHVREHVEHRWVYYPLMKPMEEAIVMKQFEWYPELGPEQGGHYHCPLHVAFKDPSAPAYAKEQVTGRHIYRFQVWFGEQVVPPLYRNAVRRNHVYQGPPDREQAIVSGGTNGEERVSDPRWSRRKQRAWAAARLQQQQQQTSKL